MKKALLLTNGSVDLALNRWLNAQTSPVDLTIVYPFSLAASSTQSLKAETYRAARQTARDELHHWLRLVDGTGPAQVRTELLLGEPELVLSIYLLIRRYDYLLLHDDQPTLANTFQACQPQIHTQVRFLPDAFRQDKRAPREATPTYVPAEVLNAFSRF